MARPRKVSDDEVFEAVQRLMGRLGPAQWTLADVAAEVGVTASALVQRFGSKKQLQVAVVERWGESAPALFAWLRRQAGTPLGAIHAYGDFAANLAGSPEGFARHLAYLQLDLEEPVTRRALQRQTRETIDALHALVLEAAQLGEIRPVDEAAAAELARLIEVVVTGSFLLAGIQGEGSARDAVRRDLDALLARWAA